MIKLLIYDLDGTLIDSLGDISASINWMLKELKFPALPEKQIGSFVGKGVHNLVRNVLREGSPKKEEPGEKLIERAVQLYRSRYQDHLLDETQLFPSVLEVLEHFKSKKQAVITNKPGDFSVQILRALKVESYFFRVIGGEVAKKPSPEPVLELMRLAGACPSEAVLIGDSDIDIQTAQNAGIKVIAVTHGFSKREELKTPRPDFLVDGFYELIRCPLLQ